MDCREFIRLEKELVQISAELVRVSGFFVHVFNIPRRVPSRICCIITEVKYPAAIDTRLLHAWAEALLGSVKNKESAWSSASTK